MQLKSLKANQYQQESSADSVVHLVVNSHSWCAKLTDPQKLPVSSSCNLPSKQFFLYISLTYCRFCCHLCDLCSLPGGHNTECVGQVQNRIIQLNISSCLTVKLVTFLEFYFYLFYFLYWNKKVKEFFSQTKTWFIKILTIIHHKNRTGNHDVHTGFVSFKTIH